MSHVEATESTSAPATGGREAPGVGTTTSPATISSSSTSAGGASATTATQTESAGAAIGAESGVGATMAEVAQKVGDTITAGTQAMANKIAQGGTGR